MTTTLNTVIDDAKLLKPGDVVAVSFRNHITPENRSIIRDQLSSTFKEFGVRFLMFEDCDLTVLRPVEDE